MRKVFLFEKSYYTGTYRCYDIDETVTKDYILLYDNPDGTIDINSVINLTTDYFVTVINFKRKQYMNIKYDMFDIKHADTIAIFPLTPKFNRVFLSKRKYSPYEFNIIQPGLYKLFEGEKIEVYRGEEQKAKFKHILRNVVNVNKLTSLKNNDMI